MRHKLYLVKFDRSTRSLLEVVAPDADQAAHRANAWAKRWGWRKRAILSVSIMDWKPVLMHSPAKLYD